MGVGLNASAASAAPVRDDEWSGYQGKTIVGNGARSKYVEKTTRTLSNPQGEPRTQHARTPHHLLNGTITPNNLHFTIIHNGTPDIDPAQHKLVIHGLVKQPLMFTIESLSRYPMESRMAFVECGGNSALMFSNEPVQQTLQFLHGFVSNSEWTGVLLSHLLDEVGIDLERGERLLHDRWCRLELLRDCSSREPFSSRHVLHHGILSALLVHRWK